MCAVKFPWSYFEEKNKNVPVNFGVDRVISNAAILMRLTKLTISKYVCLSRTMWEMIDVIIAGIVP